MGFDNGYTGSKTAKQDRHRLRGVRDDGREGWFEDGVRDLGSTMARGVRNSREGCEYSSRAMGLCTFILLNSYIDTPKERYLSLGK